MPEEFTAPVSLSLSLSPPVAASMGLAKRMAQVSRLLDVAESDLSENVTHDLRVAIRRCRSVAHGIEPLDPSGQWDKMSRELRRVFRALGHLRDLHVLKQWIDRLGEETDLVRITVTVIFQKREPVYIDRIQEALARFDKESWADWRETLPGHLREVLNSQPFFNSMALDRLQDFLASHRELATQGDLQESWHRARVALKRFRYTVENFLPERYSACGKILENLQDILGEIHDLDVLNTYLLSLAPLFEPVDRERWYLKIQQERHNRAGSYHALISPSVLLGSLLNKGK